MSADTSWQQVSVIIYAKWRYCIFNQQRGGGKMAKILIVEDEKAINDLVKFNLELVGHE